MSDRQLNSLNWHRLRMDVNVAMSRGFVWEYFLEFNVGGGGVDTLEFLVGDNPFELVHTSITTTGSRGVLVEAYVGGVVTQGLPIQDQYPMNHDVWEPSPLERVSFPANVSVGGTRISKALLGDTGRGTSGADDGGGGVFAAGTQYYVQFTNEDVQEADLYVRFVGFAITPRPRGM